MLNRIESQYFSEKNLKSEVDRLAKLLKYDVHKHSEEVGKIRMSDEPRYLEAMKAHQDELEPLDFLMATWLDHIYSAGVAKHIYGDRSIYDLVKQDPNAPRNNIAERTRHEATWGEIADAAARETMNLLQRLDLTSRNTEEKPVLLDLNTGSGSMLYSFRKNGFRVSATVDIDKTILKWSSDMWSQLGFNGDTQWVAADARDYLKELGEDHGLLVISSDPPWRGEHSDGERCGFEIFGHNGTSIVPSHLAVAPIAVLKAPHKIDNDLVYAMAQANQAAVRIIPFEMKLNETRVVREKMLIFVDKELNPPFELEIATPVSVDLM